MLKSTAALLMSACLPILAGLVGTFVAGSTGTWVGLAGGVLIVFVAIAGRAGR